MWFWVAVSLQTSAFCLVPLVFSDLCILWVSSTGLPLRIEKSALQVGTCSPAHGSHRLTWCPYWLHGELCLQKAEGPLALQLTGREALPQPNPCYHKPLAHVARLTCPCTEASHLPSGERTCLPLQTRVCVYHCHSCWGARLLQVQLVQGLLHTTSRTQKVRGRGPTPQTCSPASTPVL